MNRVVLQLLLRKAKLFLASAVLLRDLSVSTVLSLSHKMCNFQTKMSSFIFLFELDVRVEIV